MYRQFDFRCAVCDVMFTALVSVPAGEAPLDVYRWHDLDTERCPYCGGVTGAVRNKVNQVAQYLADRPFSPLVAGGSIDTAGHKKLPALPEFNGDTGKDFQDFRHTAEFKEAKIERKARAGENATKKERARLIRSGANIDIRHNPLPGDPKVMD